MNFSLLKLQHLAAADYNSRFFYAAFYEYGSARTASGLLMLFQPVSTISCSKHAVFSAIEWHRAI